MQLFSCSNPDHLRLQYNWVSARSYSRWWKLNAVSHKTSTLLIHLIPTSWSNNRHYSGQQNKQIIAFANADYFHPYNDSFIIFIQLSFPYPPSLLPLLPRNKEILDVVKNISSEVSCKTFNETVMYNVQRTKSQQIHSIRSQRVICTIKTTTRRAQWCIRATMAWERFSECIWTCLTAHITIMGIIKILSQMRADENDPNSAATNCL